MKVININCRIKELWSNRINRIAIERIDRIMNILIRSLRKETQPTIIMKSNCLIGRKILRIRMILVIGIKIRIVKRRVRGETTAFNMRMITKVWILTNSIMSTFRIVKTMKIKTLKWLNVIDSFVYNLNLIG